MVRAAGGTGKTFALEAAAEAWRRSGIPVVGCALSARAACELRDQAGIDTTTIARLQMALDEGVALSAGAVLIVDEAGMAGTRDLARLAAAAERSRAKLVLVGDDRQLPEIEAGGAFRALAERLGATELQEVRRQRQGWDRDVLAALREGRIDKFARRYLEHGHLVAAPTAEAALVEDWWAAHERGAEALMIAHRRRDVADLNARARERVLEAGRLGANELYVGGREYAIGERVIAMRNDAALGLVNGEAGVVAELASGRLTVELARSRRVEVPARYAQDGGLDYGYAVTAHRAQGATVDAAFVLGSDELYREWGYTALSRHRDTARFYVSATPAFLNEAPPALEAGDDVTRRVVAMLDESRAQHLALNGIERDRRASRLADELRREQARLAGIERQLEVLRDEHEATRWYQSGRRADLERRIDTASRDRRRSLGDVDRLSAELERRPAREEPSYSRAGDPMAAFERSAGAGCRTSRANAGAIDPVTATLAWNADVAVAREPALDRAAILAVAREVAVLLRRPAEPADGLLTAAQVAARFNVDRGWVYAHAEELGVVRLGDGPRPRLRFDPAIVSQRLVATRARTPTALPSIALRPDLPLLPIKRSRRRRTLDPEQ